MLHRRQGLLVKGKDKMIVGIVRVDSEKFNVSGLNSTDKIKWRRVIVNQLKQHHMLPISASILQEQTTPFILFFSCWTMSLAQARHASAQD